MEKLGNAILSFIRDQGFENRVKEADVIRLWKDVAGSGIAEKTEAVKLKNGVLIVHVEDSSWRSELTYMEQELINHINRRVGKKIVKKILFR